MPANFTLHLAGDGEEVTYYAKFKAAFKKYEKLNPAGPKVIYHGKIGYLEVAKLYDRAHVFVDPSLMEAQSLVLIESIASGLPIVRLYNEHTAGVTEDEKTALHVKEGSEPQQFAQKILRLVNDQVLYQKICRQQQAEREKFGRERAVEQLLEVIKKRKHK